MLRMLKTLYHLSVAVFSLLWFRFPGRKLTVIGVTGTDGKTTTSTLIYEILERAHIKASVITSVHAVIAGKTYDTGFHVTTPNAYYIQKFMREAVNHGDTHIVLEVTSHALSQFRVMGVRFAVGILTNVTHEHLDWHKTYEKYLATKLKLLRQSKTAILNLDDAAVYNRARSTLKRKRIVSYGIKRNATINPVTFPIATKLPGEFNRYNCLAAAACGVSLGVNKKIIQSAIAEFGGVPGRMEILQLSPFRVIVDFAHTPNALEQALKTVKKNTNKRLIHVFGSAGERDATKRPIMGRASDKYADKIILTEEDYRSERLEDIMDEIANGIRGKNKITRINVRENAIAFALSEAKTGDTVIITGKGHEKSLARGKIEYPWSDQESVIKLLHAN